MLAPVSNSKLQVYFSRLLTDGEDKTNLNKALPVLTIVPVYKVKEAKENEEKPVTVKEALN